MGKTNRKRNQEERERDSGERVRESKRERKREKGDPRREKEGVQGRERERNAGRERKRFRSREREKNMGQGSCCSPLTAHGQARGLAVALPGSAPAVSGGRRPEVRRGGAGDSAAHGCGRRGRPKREEKKGGCCPPSHTQHTAWLSQAVASKAWPRSRGQGSHRRRRPGRRRSPPKKGVAHGHPKEKGGEMRWRWRS